MINKVQCASCGKRGLVLMIRNKIHSRWGYRGNLEHNGKVYGEYWECRKCMDENMIDLTGEGEGK